jgi:sirohydrochlorin ferrochelatase
MPTALLVMVHGSPRSSANDQMYQVLEVIKDRQVFDIVEAGFMECNEPNIPDAIDACIAQGAERVVAVPYFLHTGTHVADDLPSLLDLARLRHPQIEFAMGRYIGAAPRLTDILADRGEERRKVA